MRTENTKGGMGLVMLATVLMSVAGASLSWQGQVRSSYDDNLFEYSASDIDRFERNAVPGQFPIRTVDDIDVLARFSATGRYRLFDRSGSVSLRTRLHQYLSNPQKSYSVADVDLGQQLWQNGRLKLGYLYMPSYLLRYYRRPGSSATGDYVECRFAEQFAEVALAQRFGPVAVTPGYGFELDDYGELFSYYDTKAHRPRFGLEWDVVRGVTVALDYELKLAEAAGPVPDVSYRQHEGSARVSVRPWRASRFGFEAGLSLAQREFTTGNSVSVDPGHAGRIDQVADLQAEVSYRLGAATLEFGYEYEQRRVDSPTSSEIEDIKDFRANRVRLGVSVGSRKVN
jgi:hypothetical protein